MDILTNHWWPTQRHFPAKFRLVTLGYQHKKVETQVRHAFDSINFSFILKGGGSYQRAGEVWEVRAPAVLLQWPGEYLEYGPTKQYGFWEEFYLIFDRSQVPDFLSAGLLKPGEFCREMGQPLQVAKRMTEMTQLTQGEVSAEKADRLDRLCELLILESLSSSVSRGDHPLEREVRSIYEHVMRNFADEPDFAALARQHGMSLSTFRRYWTALFGLPPRRSLIRLRVEKACELLVNTPLSIAEISEAVGLKDPLYFSRSFRRETGLTATNYRSRYQTP